MRKPKFQVRLGKRFLSISAAGHVAGLRTLLKPFSPAPLVRSSRAPLTSPYVLLYPQFSLDDRSCTVAQGSTRVMAVVSAALEAPYPDRPSEGPLRFNVEFSPMASPAFEPGKPGARVCVCGGRRSVCLGERGGWMGARSRVRASVDDTHEHAVAPAQHGLPGAAMRRPPPARSCLCLQSLLHAPTSAATSAATSAPSRRGRHSGGPAH